MKKELTKNLGYNYNLWKKQNEICKNHCILVMGIKNYKVTEYEVYRIKLMVTSMEGIFRAYAGMSNKKMMFRIIITGNSRFSS